MLRTAALCLILAAGANALHAPSMYAQRSAPAGTLAARPKHGALPELRGGGGMLGLEFRDVMKWHGATGILMSIMWLIPLLSGSPLKKFGIESQFNNMNISNHATWNLVLVMGSLALCAGGMEFLASTSINASNEASYARLFILYHIGLIAGSIMQYQDRTAGWNAIFPAVGTSVFGLAAVLSQLK